MSDRNIADTATTAPPERDPRLDRVLALTDGVYAIRGIKWRYKRVAIQGYT